MLEMHINILGVIKDMIYMTCPACGLDKVICSKKAAFCSKWCKTTK